MQRRRALMLAAAAVFLQSHHFGISTAQNIVPCKITKGVM
jgi:hypothetical protein